MSTHRQPQPLTDDARLVAALAEQFRMPLIQVSHTAQISRQQLNNIEKVTANLDVIEVTSSAALKLLDSYILSTQLAQNSLPLELEPVSVSSVLNDVAHRLDSYAKLGGSRLELQLNGRLGPVMSYRPGLEAAMLALGLSFIDAANHAEDKKPSGVMLTAYKTSQGVSAGLFSGVDGLSSDMLRRARALYGRARQPMAAFAGGSVGIFVADNLCSSMTTRLRTARFRNQSGLAATLLPSRQLCLV